MKKLKVSVLIEWSVDLSLQFPVVWIHSVCNVSGIDAETFVGKTGQEMGEYN